MLKKSCFTSLLMSALLPATLYAASPDLLKVQVQFEAFTLKAMVS
jgi:hypothetical protein